MVPGNTVRRKYLRTRSAILQNRYHVHSDLQSNSACSRQSTSLVSDHCKYTFFNYSFHLKILSVVKK